MAHHGMKRDCFRHVHAASRPPRGRASSDDGAVSARHAHYEQNIVAAGACTAHPGMRFGCVPALARGCKGCTGVESACLQEHRAHIRLWRIEAAVMRACGSWFCRGAHNNPPGRARKGALLDRYVVSRRASVDAYSAFVFHLSVRDREMSSVIFGHECAFNLRQCAVAMIMRATGGNG
jgi:hypothetical protein